MWMDKKKRKGKNGISKRPERGIGRSGIFHVGDFFIEKIGKSNSNTRKYKEYLMGHTFNCSIQ
jgi:hypothetical protein